MNSEHKQGQPIKKMQRAWGIEKPVTGDE